jgi:N-acetylmuramic acid 6-phosphate etherase
MSVNENARRRSMEFLKVSDQFRLGALLTEASHPVTAVLSDLAKQDIAAALDALFQVDADVVKVFREFAQSGRAGEMAASVLAAIRNGGSMFFTGCGATGRLSILLDSIWRDFWRQRNSPELENRAFSVMAGGDFALIKSVEGFEDFAAFGRKQISDLNVSAKDVVFAITEGGETSFVIGTAWAGVVAGAKVFFVYNNPDQILCQHVGRSREVIADARIEKINLTTGPMAITGSTRMQATSIQLCVMLTVLEMVACELVGRNSADVPTRFLEALQELHVNLRAPEFLAQLTKLVALEETAYRTGHKTNYFAGRFGIDVLTDTTERSPTFCTPPFRKFDDMAATESWAFLFQPVTDTPAAWRNILKREPRCVEWREPEMSALVPPDKLARTREVVRKISSAELLRYKIGLDGLPYRPFRAGDAAVAVLAGKECEAGGICLEQLEAARQSGARCALLCFGDGDIQGLSPEIEKIFVRVPETGLLLNGVNRVAVKLVLNALSTCTMVRLGRVMGNFMVWVVPSNLKLIDRATRYISQLAGLDYETANALLFEVIEYIEPRMKADQAYPPAVEMAVTRARLKCGNQEAERQLCRNDFVPATDGHG